MNLPVDVFKIGWPTVVGQGEPNTEQIVYEAVMLWLTNNNRNMIDVLIRNQ